MHVKIFEGTFWDADLHPSVWLLSDANLDVIGATVKKKQETRSEKGRKTQNL